MCAARDQRYATSATTGFVVRELSRKASILPPQEFVVRNDCPCGSTIGPAIAALTGIRTVDVGISCWSMHSIRETIGVDDVESSIKLFTTFYKSFRESSGECVRESRCACMCETALPRCQQGSACECVTTIISVTGSEREGESARAYVFLFPLSPVLALSMPSHCSAPSTLPPAVSPF